MRAARGEVPRPGFARTFDLARALGFALGLAFALALGAAPARAASDEELAREAGRLARANELLKRRLELAESKEFYLLLDPAQRRLRVMLAGVTLREYPVERMEYAVPRRRTLAADAAVDWVDRVWKKGLLDPERERDRLEVLATGDSTTMPEIPVPPLPEEALHAPARYWIRYAEGFSVEIRNISGLGTQPVERSFLERLLAPLLGLVSSRETVEGESVRLMLQLGDVDAAALYRSLPPDTHFLVLYDPTTGTP